MTSVLDINVRVRECDELLRVHRPIHASRPIQSADAVSNRSTGGGRSIGAHSRSLIMDILVKEVGSHWYIEGSGTERMGTIGDDATRAYGYWQRTAFCVQ